MALPTGQIRRSNKKIVDLSYILKSYVFTPSVDVVGGVCGVSFNFQRGKTYEISYEIYDALLNSSFASELK